MLQFSEFVWALRSSVWDVFNNFLLIDATDSSKISSDQKRFFIALNQYPLSFFANTPFNENKCKSIHEHWTCFCLRSFSIKNFWMVFGSKMCWKLYKFKPLNLQLFPGSRMRNIILTSIIEALISLTFSNISSFDFKPTKETNYNNDWWKLKLKFQNICSNIFQGK